MKKVILLSVVLWSVAFALGAAGATLLNPSFEELGNEFDQAAGWSRWGDWINREDSWTPTHSGSCLMGYHHWQIEKPETSGLWQDIHGVVPGKNYTFSIYANADAAGEGQVNPEAVEIRLETTIDGKQSTVASQVFDFSSLARGEDWSRLQVRGTAPNDKLRVLVIMKPGPDGQRGGSIKFDDAALGEN